jgi:2-deoxy-D-gluconate 3-dehydrogenase
MSVLDQFNLVGKTALVTGCKRGIGKSMVMGLPGARMARQLGESLGL